MQIYRFTLRNDVADVEDLDYLAMPDDHDALRFGRTTVRELTRKRPQEYAGFFMNIAQEGRAVGRVPCDFETDQRQKKFG